MSDYIQKTVAQFWEKLDEADQKLKEFSNDIGNREDQIFALLTSLQKNSELSLPIINGTENEVQKKMHESLVQFDELIQAWSKSIENNKKGQAFIHENEKHMLVMVFGKVNTGKSSLGNFFAGKPFLHASVDTEFKSRLQNSPPSFKVEIEGRPKNLEGGWFREGVVDTTGAIQHFTVPGLRWVDSPGTGAVEKAGDTCNMEKLVRQYINYVDLGIFLMSSDSPGLQPDFQYIERLQKNNKTAVVVITKSDYNDEQFVNGNIVPNWVAKENTDRHAQETWIKNELTKRGIEDEFQVLSVSTYLADQAVKRESDEMFRASQMDQLMHLLGAKVSAEALALKERNPKDNVNYLIRDILQGIPSDEKEKGFEGVWYLRKKFEEVLKSITSYQEKLKNLEAQVVQKTLSKVKPQLQIEISSSSRRVERENHCISGQELSELTRKVLQHAIQVELDMAITELITSFQTKQLTFCVNIQMDMELKKEQEVLKQKFIRYSRVERDPDGFWESTRAFFGKTYYKSEKEEEIRYTSIDVGTNLQSVLDKLMEMVDQEVSKTIQRELERLASEYFAPQEKYIITMLDSLRQFEHSLERLKFPV